MKLFPISLENITQGAKDAAKRFPMAILSAVTVSFVGIVLIHTKESSSYFDALLKIILTLALAFPLFAGITLFGERRAWILKQNIIAIVSAIIFLMGYYLWLPKNIFGSEEIFIIRYVLWVIGFILFVTFAPFIKKLSAEEINGFWQYNRALFFSLALTLIWAGALQAGISIALASIDFLFKVNIDGDRYMELWIIVAGIFSTTFFLSHIPKDIENFNDSEEYPKELRLFSQYVLAPLVTVYFLILYAYVVRVLILWEWPSGTLAYMILGFSFLGMLTYASLYPLKNTVLWVQRAGNIFYFIIIPQIGMLFWALWFRISQYGFTENRYFVFVFGWWLLGIAVYFIVGKKKDIRLIPITIFIIALFSSFGPWGAFSISEKSQITRLKIILVKNNILVNEKVIKSTGEISVEDEREISATLQYLNEVHGMKGVQPWFNQDLSSLKDEINYSEIRDEYDRVRDPRPSAQTETYYDRPEKIAKDLMGIEYVDRWEVVNPEDKNFYFYPDYEENGKLLNISKYDYTIILRDISGENSPDIAVGNSKYKFTLNERKNQIIAFKNDQIVANFDLENLLRGITKKGKTNLGREFMKAELENEQIKILFYFEHIDGERKDNDGYQVNSMGVTVFFSVKS